LILAGAASLPLLAVSAPQEPVAATPEAPASISHQAYLVPQSGQLLMPWPRQYQGGLTVIEVVPHGTWVEEGQVIARLDMESYERQLHSAEIALEGAERRLHHMYAQHDMATESAYRDMEDAALRVEQAQRKLLGWTEFELEFAQADRDMSAMYREHSIHDATDELEQLEAMYTDDELTDATEEIVLMRSRRNLERSKLAARLSEARAEYQADFNWDRTTMQYERAVQSAELNLHHQEKRMQLAEESRAAEREAAERGLDEAARKLDGLRQDREQLMMRAPSRGVLLHGDMHDGARTARHHMGSSLSPRSVAFSVATPGDFVARFEVPGEQLRQLKNGAACEVHGVNDGRQIAGKLQIEAYPNPSGMYQATVFLDGDQQSWVAGSNVRLEFTGTQQ